MATVAEALRTTRITLEADGDGPFEIGFRLFEADGIAVYVNDAIRTDYTVSATFLNGYTDAATITFTDDLSDGDVIQIDGEQPAYRSVDYTNGDPLLNRKLNIEQARQWAAISEIKMQAERAVRGLTEVLPIPGAAAGYVLDITRVVTTVQLGMDNTDIGQFFAVAASGNLSLYQNDGEDGLVMADPYIPPGGMIYPAVAATPAAIIAMMTALKATAVPLLVILGRNYAGTGAGPTLTTAFASLAAAGIAIIDPQGLAVTIGDGEVLGGGDSATAIQVTLASNLKWFLPNTTFVRNFSADGVTRATFTTGAGDTRLTGLKLFGGTFDVQGGEATEDIEGHHWKFYADDSYVDSIRWLNHFKGAAWFARGNRTRFNNVQSITQDLDAGEDADTDTASAGFRISEGEDFWVTNFVAIGANDQCMLVIGMSDGGTEVIRRCGYVNGTVTSTRAKVLTCGASENGGPVTGFLGGIYDCLFQNITGTSGRYFYRVVADGSDRKWTIDGVVLRGIKGTLDQTGNEGIDAMQIKGLQDPNNDQFGSVGRVTLEDIDIQCTAVRTAGVISAPGAVVTITNYKVNGDRLGTRIQRPCHVMFHGDVVISGPAASPDEGADADADDRSPLKVEREANGADVDAGDDYYFGGMSPALIEFFTRPQFINVATPTVDGSQRFLAGIRARGGTIILHNGAEVNAAPDADPGTKFARITETARIVYAPTKITGTVTDLTVDGSGGQSWLARERAVTPDGASAAVIASNVVTLAYADMNLIDTEGSAAADNLDGVILPTDLVVGDVFPIRTANDGRDITIRHNRTPAGAEKRIFTPAGIHFTLSDTDDVAYGTWDGTRLVITSVILTTNANGSSSKGFGSRSVMVAYAAIVTPQVGTVWTAAGLSYRYIGTGTAIADMAGWVPDGRVYADHYNQNITPGTTDMAAAALAAADYVGNNGGGKVLFGPENYRFAEPVDISNVGVWFEGDGYVATNTDAGQTRIIIDHDLGPGIRFSAFSHGLINIVVSGSAARAAAGLLGSNGEPNYGILIEAPDVSGGAGYIQRGLIRNVTVRGQPNDLIVTAGENSGTTFENVAAIYGGRHGFVFSNGLHTGRTNLSPPGICILSNCRATDLEGHALAAGDPADSGLSAYRLTILQFEYFRCGADPSLLHEPAGIFLMGQNHKIIQSAGGEAGQAFACVAGRNNDIDNCRLFGTSAMAPILVREYPNDSTRGINVINPSLLPTSGIYPVIVDIGAGCQEVSVTVKHDQRGNNTTYADVVTPGYGGTQVNSSDLFSISTPMEAESFRSGPEVSIADDAVYAYEFSPGTTSHGVLLFHGNSDGTIYGMFVFRAAASGSYITPMLPSGSNTDAVLTALTGTTGTNGRFTVGVTQDAIYFENRRGGARSIVLTFLSGNFRKEYLT